MRGVEGYPEALGCKLGDESDLQVRSRDSVILVSARYWNSMKFVMMPTDCVRNSKS